MALDQRGTAHNTYPHLNASRAWYKKNRGFSSLSACAQKCDLSMDVIQRSNNIERKKSLSLLASFSNIITLSYLKNVLSPNFLKHTTLVVRVLYLRNYYLFL